MVHKITSVGEVPRPMEGMFVVSVSEGRACHARRTGMDYPMWRDGRHKRVPPKGGPDERVPPKCGSGGARLSCPGQWDG